MFAQKAVADAVVNAAGSGISSVAGTSFNAESGEFILCCASYEVANPTMTPSDNLGGQTWNSLTQQHDAGDVKGHQFFWVQLTAAKTGFVPTVSFSPSGTVVTT